MQRLVDEISIHKRYYNDILNELKNDRFAAFLGAKIVEFGPGLAIVQTKVQENMLNAHSTAHGGLLYSIADYAFAIACNSYGRAAVGLSTTTNFMKSAFKEDVVIAKATEIRRNYRTGFYRIEIETNNETIASIEAIAYRKSNYFIKIDE